MAQNNSINNVTTELEIDPGASGDSFVQFSINGTGEFRVGVDDDAADTFVIAQGSALGTNNTYVMTAAGEVTEPLNPAFMAYLPSDDLNETGDATQFTIGSTTALTEVFDQGGDFNTNGTFTAPVTGRYYLSAMVSLLTPASGGEQAFFRISTSNRLYTLSTMPQYDLVTSFSGDGGVTGFTVQCIADMDAADTATTIITGSGGAKTADVDGSGSFMFTNFSGYLLT